MLKFIKEKSAQGALEYLLIIAGAILIVAIVLSIVISSADESADSAKENEDVLGDTVKDKQSDIINTLN
jgi:uncharacterized protein (UPF0333 family)